MPESQPFHISDVITVATGTLVSTRHIEGVYDLCNFMTGESLMTHQLPRAARESEPSLRAQHPELTDEPIPPISSQEDVEAWMATLYPKYGETVTVTALEPGEHTHRDPLEELAEMAPHMTVIPVMVPDEDASR